MKGFEKKENHSSIHTLTESRYSRKVSEEHPPQPKTHETLDIKRWINSPMSLKRILGDAVEEIQGMFIGIDGNKWSPLLMVESNGKLMAAIMYDKDNNEFVEGLISTSMVYEPLDLKTGEILSRFKNK